MTQLQHVNEDVDPADPAEPATTGPVPAAGLPRSVALGLVALYLLLGVAWSLLTPPFRGVDEPTHIDTIRHIRAEMSVPRSAYRYDRSTLAAGVGSSLGRGGRFDRPAADRARGLAFGPPQGPMTEFRINQMYAHPPLPYVTQAVALVAVDTVTDVETMPARRVIGILRLIGVATLAPIPLLLAGATRRLGGSRTAQGLAALLPVGVPQLWYVSTTVGNDGWILLGGALAAFSLAVVVSGDTRLRQAALLGGVVGVASLTKAFGLVLFALPTLAYAYLGWRRLLPWAAAAGRAAAGTAVAMAVGGWWWVWNLFQYGSVQPMSSPVADAVPPASFEPMGFEYWTQFASWIVSRYWGWFWSFAAGVRLPIVLVVIATSVAVVVLVTTLARGTSPQRWFALCAVGVHVVVLANVASAARRLHVENGVLQGIQGRYLFVALPALAVAAALGVEDWRRRLGAGPGLAGAVVTVAVAVGTMQAFSAWAILDAWWGDAPGQLRDAVRSVGAWQPWPPALLVPAAVLLAAGVAWGGGRVLLPRPLARRGPRESPPGSGDVHLPPAAPVPTGATRAG